MGWAAAAALVATAGSVYSADQQRSASNRSTDQAKANAQKQADLQEQENNKANSKTADVSSILSATQNAAKGGQSGTMLTGSSGVAGSGLSLGKSTLLGS